MMMTFAQNIIKQMPPHQVKFEREAIRTWLGVENFFSTDQMQFEPMVPMF
jgi:hypothetical protein